MKSVYVRVKYNAKRRHYSMRIGFEGKYQTIQIKRKHYLKLCTLMLAKPQNRHYLNDGFVFMIYA